MIIETGTDALRATVAARLVKRNSALWARELGVPTDALERFAKGTLILPVDVLHTLTKDIFHDTAVFDPEANVLRNAPKPEPKPLGIAMPPFERKAETWPMGEVPRGPQPVTPQPVKPKVKRPGWAE